MLWGSHQGGLELRTEGGETRLRASFPYGRETVLSDGAQPRKEIIESRAFADRIERGEEIHFLSGHDYNKPLASTRAGTLTLRDTDTALEVEAVIRGGTTWARDSCLRMNRGLSADCHRAFAFARVVRELRRAAGQSCAPFDLPTCSRLAP